MKYAAIKHVPVFGGSVKSVDKSEALAMPGVVDVVVIPRFNNPYGSLGGVAVVADNTWTAEEALKYPVLSRVQESRKNPYSRHQQLWRATFTVLALMVTSRMMIKATRHLGGT